jgi:hypothetical protein
LDLLQSSKKVRKIVIIHQRITNCHSIFTLVPPRCLLQTSR